MEWISVEDEPPIFSIDEYFQMVNNGKPPIILISDGKEVWTSVKNGDMIMFEANNHPYKVTHWMPLPEPPNT